MPDDMQDVNYHHDTSEECRTTLSTQHNTA